MSEEKDSLVEAVKKMQAVLKTARTMIREAGVLEEPKEQGETE